MFGRYERQISEAYRSIYLNIDEFIEQVRRWCPAPRTLLEVGCGEGAVSERLRGAFPCAHVTAIDVTSRIGRLYRGPREAVRFIRCEVQQIAASNPRGFDLVVLCDVLHHVPQHARQPLLAAIPKTLAPGGALIFKDWERTSSPIHWLCYASDRWLTGDKISFMTRNEMREHLASAFGQTALVAETRIRPHWNNLATFVRI
jgi:2-polyprenyl-6-hydroxyphenyl methylase/3-demethylubiquinone-9 3-methyltransferase